MPNVISRNSSDEISLSQWYTKRKKILVRRNQGGLGDILMQRMLFEDFKLLMPDVYIVYACPYIYHQGVSDHPYIDEIVDSKTIREQDFVIVYDITSACSRTELRLAPNCDIHRADIWAEHCGVTLTQHNMHFRLSDDERSWAKNILSGSNPTTKKTVLVAPVSAMQGKNMEPRQIMPAVEELKNRGYYVFGLHNLPLLEYPLPYLCGTNIRQFISIINEVDYVISVDTSTFHCAGGLGKKMVAVFGWADGKVYSKYYPNTVLVQKHRDHTPGWTCGPCYTYSQCCKEPNDSVIRKPCITEITPEMILDGFDKLVEGDI